MTKASFIKKKRDAEWQAESLRLEKEMEKARARVRIYENENQDQEMAFKMEEHKQDKIIYHQQTTKHSEINQHGDRKTLEYRTFTAAFFEKAMTRNYNVHLDKRHEQIQLNLKLQTQRKQLRITKWGRCFAS